MPEPARRSSPRRADAARNEAAILRAARDLMTEGAVPSMDQVARAAGIARVTLYGHFSSREVLLEAVVGQAMAEVDGALADLYLDEGPADEALVRLVKTSWDILERYSRVREVTLREIGPSRVHARYDPLVRHLERLLVRGQVKGDFVTDLPVPWLAAALQALLHAAADEINVGNLGTDGIEELLVRTALTLVGPTQTVGTG